MIQKRWIGLALLGIIAGVVIVAAVETYMGNQTATVNALEIWLTGSDDIPVELKDGDPIEWGPIDRNEEYTYMLKVINNYDTDRIIHFLHAGLPTDWIQTWAEDGATVISGGEVEGLLTLTATTILVDVTWTWEITATIPP